MYPIFDCDGIQAANLVKRAYPNAFVIFPRQESDFGLNNETFDLIDKVEFDTLYLLDSGVTKVSMDNCAKLADMGKQVIVIDHHPQEVDIKEYQNANLKICSDKQHCTTSLVYELFLEQELIKPDDRWAKIWTLVGIQGDMATNKEKTPKSANLFERLKQENLQLSGQQLFWSARGGSTPYEILMMVARYWNTPRRLAHESGAYVGLRACNEIEVFGDLFIVMKPLEEWDEISQAVLSSTYLIVKWQREYLERRSDVFKAIQFFNFDLCSISVINHRWDIGGYIAQIKSEELKKAAFVINTGMVGGWKITARNVDTTLIKLHVGEVFNTARELSEGKVAGGGHEFASGAGSTVRNLSYIIAIILEAVKQVKAKEVGIMYG